MATPNTVQKELLKPASSCLDAYLSVFSDVSKRSAARLSILEQCSSIIGGFNLKRYRRITKWDAAVPDDLDTAKIITSAIQKIPISPALTLSILATEDLSTHTKRTTGAYYTDFRLARALAETFARAEQPTGEICPRIIDLAAGSGILLVALAIVLGRKRPIADVICESIYGVDLSEMAIRGACLSLASLTDCVDSIQLLRTHLAIVDSLIAPTEFWQRLSPKGFDGCIGNPPWEKLRLSAHEHLRANGHSRHYGDEYTTLDGLNGLADSRAAIKKYAVSIKHLLPDVAGEADLYMPFLQLAHSITKPNGSIAYLVPASLIRTQSAQPLRRYLVAHASSINLQILDNKARFFEIDTRFKFLLLQSQVGSHCRSIQLSYPSPTQDGLLPGKPITLSAETLRSVRPDLSLPEVRTVDEWKLFQKIANSHPTFGDPKSGWAHSFHRELDMTLDRSLFKRTRTNGDIPLIEGRMVHQFKYGAKAYISGTGRRAIWETRCTKATRELKPQFYVSVESLPLKLHARYNQLRPGFCDITGQTNERTMLTAIIPPGTACGNKVPTIDFTDSKNCPQLSYLWVGFANSFVFDWLLRRTITTTANFFIVDGIPVPIPDLNNPIHIEIANIAKELSRGGRQAHSWVTAKMRATLDTLAAQAYGLNVQELELMLDDFKSLDRFQPCLTGEDSCKVTREFVLVNYLSKLFPADKMLKPLTKRIKDYEELGAIPYVPSQFVRVVEAENELTQT
jgi:Alw26I/Eco31I/Esp3I family type II restriction m6 adenine DNA methyltransferase